MGSTLYQYLAVFSANLCTIGYGNAVGWTAASFLTLSSTSSPLPSGPANMSEIAWIGSMLAVGGLLGTPVVGWMVDRYGRKFSLLSLAVPQLLGWLLIMYAQNVYYLYVSRFLSGIAGGGAFIIIPMICAEISENKVRGTLCSLVVLSSNLGILLGFTAGHFLSYEVIPRFFMIFCILFILSYSFMPETPYYLTKTNQIEAAKRSLMFYRNVKVSRLESNKLFEEEFEVLKTNQLRASKNEENGEKVMLKDFACRSFVIGVALMCIHDCCGLFVMTSYAGIIFKESGSDLSPTVSTIILGTIQFVGSYTSTICVDRLGRRLLLILSLLGTAVCQIVLGTHMLLATLGVNLSQFQWIPVASFSLMLFVGSCGALPIPYVILSEILPSKIRGMGVSACLLVSWILTFVLMSGFPPVLALLHLHGCLYLFAVFCFCAIFYTALCIPETKGKSLQEILKILKT